MKILIAAIILVGICVFGMCFNIIFRKNGHFPQTDVGSNDDMRKMGIKCMREEDDELFDPSKKKAERKSAYCSGEYSDACAGCSLFNLEKKK
jgi:CRISPR/Cas system CMR-associated protein Cmr3 (group 5 of RAMP superfamily)